MNNDLISREALKKEIEKYRPKSTVKSLFLDGLNCMFMNCISVIDNAPTVSPKQGEWGKWVITEIQCPNCFGYFETNCYSKEELKKCPNCGADMRGAE